MDTGSRKNVRDGGSPRDSPRAKEEAPIRGARPIDKNRGTDLKSAPLFRFVFAFGYQPKPATALAIRRRPSSMFFMDVA